MRNPREMRFHLAPGRWFLLGFALLLLGFLVALFLEPGSVGRGGR